MKQLRMTSWACNLNLKFGIIYVFLVIFQLLLFKKSFRWTHSSKLPVSSFLDYKQDTTINCASVVCDTKNKQPVRRSSSTRGKTTMTGSINNFSRGLFYKYELKMCSFSFSSQWLFKFRSNRKCVTPAGWKHDPIVCKGNSCWSVEF